MHRLILSAAILVLAGCAARAGTRAPSEAASPAKPRFETTDSPRQIDGRRAIPLTAQPQGNGLPPGTGLPPFGPKDAAGVPSIPPAIVGISFDATKADVSRTCVEAYAEEPDDGTFLNCRLAELPVAGLNLVVGLHLADGHVFRFTLLFAESPYDAMVSMYGPPSRTLNGSPPKPHPTFDPSTGMADAVWFPSQGLIHLTQYDGSFIVAFDARPLEEIVKE